MMNRILITLLILVVGLSFTVSADIVPLLTVGGFGSANALSLSATSINYGPKVGLDLISKATRLGLSAEVYLPVASITRGSTAISLQERIGLKKIFIGRRFTIPLMIGGSAKEEDILSPDRSWKFGIGGEIGFLIRIGNETAMNFNIGGDYFLDNTYDITADVSIAFAFE